LLGMPRVEYPYGMTTSPAHGIGRIPQWTMGDRIRKARRESPRHITQQRLADEITRAGYPIVKQAVGNWEAGKNDVEEQWKVLVAGVVATLTGFPAKWLLGAATLPDPGVYSNSGCSKNPFRVERIRRIAPNAAPRWAERAA
jgi:hypothetical protein